jgi:hypothetical protein
VSWPVPRPGLVIRYSYLWESEARQGREEGVKDRPCAIVLVILREGEHRGRITDSAEAGEASEVTDCVAQAPHPDASPPRLMRGRGAQRRPETWCRKRPT